jgi:septal ring factor EnvC (AmiA/AmiB activator)
LDITVKYFFEGKVIPTEGNVLRGGDVIGTVGGESISEVYFETWYQGRVIDPEYLVKF